MSYFDYRARGIHSRVSCDLLFTNFFNYLANHLQSPYLRGNYELKSFTGDCQHSGATLCTEQINDQTDALKYERS